MFMKPTMKENNDPKKMFFSAVRWRCNLFTLPTGCVGAAICTESADLTLWRLSQTEKPFLRVSKADFFFKEKKSCKKIKTVKRVFLSLAKTSR
jgi:hypothetical protein